MGSDLPNGQDLATRGTITYQVQEFDTNVRGYNILVGTVRQVDIEKPWRKLFSFSVFFLSPAAKRRAIFLPFRMGCDAIFMGKCAPKAH